MEDVHRGGLLKTRAICADILCRIVKRCRVCGRPLQGQCAHLCPDCAQYFTLYTSGFCPMCGRLYQRKEKYLCADCRRSPRPWSKLGFFGPYEGILQDVLLEFKFGAKLEWSSLLRFVLAQTIGFHFPDHHSITVVPVPSHPTRIRERGMNQSLELAKMVARIMGRDLLCGALIRTRPTPPQSRLSRTQRMQNLKKAFRAPKNSFAGKDVLLVDDVMTTGSTVAACTKTILRAGAERVSVLVVAVAE
ncbi:MAG: phosphoribosyltransferase family protein [Desulfovibrionales bacterium]